MLLELQHQTEPQDLRIVEFEVEAFVVQRLEIRDLREAHYHLRWYLRDGNSKKKLVYQHYLRHRTQPSHLLLMGSDLWLAGDSKAQDPVWSQIRSQYPDLILHLGDNINLGTEVSQLKKWASISTDLAAICHKLFGQKYRQTWQRWIPELDGIQHNFCLGPSDLANLRSYETRKDGISNSLLNQAFRAYDLYQSQLNGQMWGFSDGRPWIKRWNIRNKRVNAIFLDFEIVYEISGTRLRFSMLDLLDPEVELLLLIIPFNPLEAVRRTNNGTSHNYQQLSHLLSWLRGWKAYSSRRRVILISLSSFGATGTIKWKSQNSEFQALLALVPPVTEVPDLTSQIQQWYRQICGYQTEMEDGTISFKLDSLISTRGFLTLDLSTSEPSIEIHKVEEPLQSRILTMPDIDILQESELIIENLSHNLKLPKLELPEISLPDSELKLPSPRPLSQIVQEVKKYASYNSLVADASSLTRSLSQTLMRIRSPTATSESGISPD